MAANVGRPAKCTPGVEALWDWVERRSLNQREAADLLEMNFVSLNQILMGRRRPGLAVAMRIERHSGIDAGIWLRTQVSRLGFRESENPRKRLVSNR